MRLESKVDILKKNRVERIAKAKNVTMAQVALAWVMSQEGNFSSTQFLTFSLAD